MSNISKKYKKIVGMAVLAIIFSSAAPQPAHAVLPVIDPAEIYQVIVGQTQAAAQAAIKAFGDNLQAALGIRNTQAVVDATDKAALTNAALETAAKYAPNVDSNGNLTNNTCNDQGVGKSAQGMKDGAGALAGALAGNPPPPSTPAAQISIACAYGYVPGKDELDLVKANKNCANTDPQRINADINVATLDADDMMTLPPYDATVPPVNGINMSGGYIQLPPSIAGYTPQQKDFIASIKVCENLINPSPPSFSATGTPTITTQILGRQQQRMDNLSQSSNYYTCFKKVLYNTAITVSAAKQLDGGNGPFSQLATQQQTACSGMTTEGLIDVDIEGALANCTSNGISLAAVDKINNLRYTSNGYKNYLYGQNLTPEDVTMLSEWNKQSMLIADRIEKATAAMQATAYNTKPAQTASAPTPLGMPVAAGK